MDLAASRYDAALALTTGDAAMDAHFATQAMINRAAVDHERGDMGAAIRGYRGVLAQFPNNTQALNNLGAALVTVGDHDEAVRALKACLSLDEAQPQALTNLAMHYANEGEIADATALLHKARALLNPAPGRAAARYAGAGLLVREATMMRPMVDDAAGMYAERVRFASRIMALRHALETTASLRGSVEDPVNEVEHVHFYVPYSGLNDRYLQEAVVACYRVLAPKVFFYAPHVEPTRAARAADRRASAPTPSRVGFVSKFFGEHEPHGLLLEGLVQHLPRDRFTVVVCPIASPGRPAASELLRESADELRPVGLNYYDARQTLAAAELDVLVFADMLSEPMSYFLGFGRFAPVQIAFWGNPITTGREEIDYFVSADRMEAPFRTLQSDADEPWTEQVVLLDGQGIWYRKPTLPPGLPAPPPGDAGRRAAIDAGRRALNVSLGDWPLLLIPQSVFKLHPAFDAIVGRILARAPAARVLFTEGRRQTWTAALRARLRKALGDDLMRRVIFLPRRRPGSRPVRRLQGRHLALHPALAT